MSKLFASGSEAMQQAAQQPSFARTQFFKLGDGDECYVRFLTDRNDWVTVLQHNGAPTRPRPSWLKPEDNWWPRWGVVCRNTIVEQAPGRPKLWEVMDDKDDMPGCYVCDHVVEASGKHAGKPHRASGRGWALVCLREEVLGDGSDALGGAAMKGQPVGYRDKVREVTDKDGKTTTEKDVRVVNLGWKNFFSILEGPAARFGTVLDRDYYIKRSGDDKDTTYQIVNMDATQGHDLRDPETLAKYDIGLDLDEVIMEQAQARYLRRFFDPNYTPPVKEDNKSSSNGGGGGAPAEQQAQAPSGDATPDQMQAMMARVSGTVGQPAPAEQEATEPASAQEEAKAASSTGGPVNFD